jgi:hypothetical protein
LAQHRGMAETTLLESLLGRRPPEPVDDVPPTPRLADLTAAPPIRQWTRKRWTRFSRQITDDTSLPALPMRVALALALRHVDAWTGAATITADRLAGELGASIDGVRRALRTLRDHGHLGIERQRGGPNVYRPILRQRDYWRLTEAGTGRRRGSDHLARRA